MTTLPTIWTFVELAQAKIEAVPVPEDITFATIG